MGIDHVDRAYRSRVIALECTACGTTAADVQRRAHWFCSEQSAVMCHACWDVWTPEAPRDVAPD
jgi:hypothetical protein